LGTLTFWNPLGHSRPVMRLLYLYLCFVDRLTGGTREKPNHEEAFLLWKREKDKLLKQKKTEQKIQNKKLKSDNEKKAAAEMVS
jgi:hypothetical protein